MANQWVEAFNWCARGFDKVTHFFKKKGRRDAVKKMRKATDDHNSKYINDELRKLKQKRKDKYDSR